MLNIIKNNPFRVLGVYSNASKKEITANSTKLKAFINVNKEISFSSELSWKMDEIKRTTETVDSSLAKINLLEDKIVHSLFWFANASVLDKAALNNLEAGNEDKAIEIWGKKECFSSCLNLAVLALVNNNLGKYLTNIYAIIRRDDYRKELFECICDETFEMSKETLAHKLYDALLLDVDPSDVYDEIQKNGLSIVDGDYLKEKVLQKPTSIIYSEISKAQSVDREDANANYLAGKSLLSATRVPLNQIKKLVGANDSAYQIVADKLAQAILQCGINYFNNTDDDDDVDKALSIQQAAAKIAVGTLVKDRCKQNVDILLKRKDQLDIKKDIDVIARELASFQSESASITNVRLFINECKPHLMNISNTLGSNNDLYIKISTAVANNALGMLVTVVNNKQKYMSDKSALLETVNSALSLMDQIGALAMTTQERNHFSTNKSTLISMKSQLSLYTSYGTPSSGYRGSNTSTSTSNNDDDNIGCLFAIAGVVILIIIIIACS